MVFVAQLELQGAEEALGHGIIGATCGRPGLRATSRATSSSTTGLEVIDVPRPVQAVSAQGELSARDALGVERVGDEGLGELRLDRRAMGALTPALAVLADRGRQEAHRREGARAGAVDERITEGHG